MGPLVIGDSPAAERRSHALPTRTPVRLLVLLPSLRGGGVERYVETLLPGFDPARVSASLGLLHRRGEGQYADGIPPDVPIIDFEKRSPLDVWTVIRRIARYFEDARPDVVLGVMTYQNLLALAARRASRHRPSVIVTEHTNPEMLSRSLRRRWQLHLGRRLYRDSYAVVCVSDGQREEVLRHFRVPPERVVRIYNGSHRGAVQPMIGEPHGWPRSGPVIVFAGRLTEVKGVRYLLDAMAILRRRLPAHLLVLGDGEQRSDLEARVGQLGLAEAVTFLGHVADPTPYFARSDAVAVPSLAEALSLTLIEAARAGAAIVASDCDYGPREIITDSVTGMLVPPADAPALADALERLLVDRVLNERLRRAALSDSARFAPERMVEAYEDLIASAAAGAPRLP